MVGMVEDAQVMVSCHHHRAQWASNGLEMLLCNVMNWPVVRY
jgi:hypothetical protein